MKRIVFAVLLLSSALVAASFAADPVTAKITADRVNLRAKPETTAEVVGQVGEGDVLTVKSIQTDWIEVVPPDSVELWVHKDFISEAKSAVSKLNVRAGPGINYNVVGNLAKGETVTVKGTFGDWVRIAPSPSTSLWLSKDFVQLNLPVKKIPAPVAVSTSRPPVVAVATTTTVVATAQVARVAATVDTPPPPPSDLILIPLTGQGKLVDREGELKPAPYVVGRPSAFRLVQRTGVRIDTVCYLRGNSEQLQALMGQRLAVHGREYWVQGVREAIVVIESIEKLPLSP